MNCKGNLKNEIIVLKFCSKQDNVAPFLHNINISFLMYFSINE